MCYIKLAINIKLIILLIMQPNPSNIIYHKNKDKVDYTFKNTVSNQTIYISGINTEILDLQKICGSTYH